MFWYFYFFVILVGWNSKAAATYQNLVSKFPSDVTVRKKLGVSYLLMGQNEKARRVFSDVSLYILKNTYVEFVSFTLRGSILQKLVIDAN